METLEITKVSIHKEDVIFYISNNTVLHVYNRNLLTKKKITILKSVRYFKLSVKKSRRKICNNVEDLKA